MNQKSKAESIIGFALKAGKVTFGADNIENSQKNRLIICDKLLSENTLKKMQNIAQDDNIKLLIYDNSVEELVCRKNVKAFAITDRQMTNAILKDHQGFTLINPKTPDKTSN